MTDHWRRKVTKSRKIEKTSKSKYSRETSLVGVRSSLVAIRPEPRAIFIVRTWIKLRALPTLEITITLNWYWWYNVDLTRSRPTIQLRYIKLLYQRFVPTYQYFFSECALRVLRCQKVRVIRRDNLERRKALHQHDASGAILSCRTRNGSARTHALLPPLWATNSPTLQR